MTCCRSFRDLFSGLVLFICRSLLADNSRWIAAKISFICHLFVLILNSISTTFLRFLSKMIFTWWPLCCLESLPTARIREMIIWLLGLGLGSRRMLWLLTIAMNWNINCLMSLGLGLKLGGDRGKVLLILNTRMRIFLISVAFARQSLLRVQNLLLRLCSQFRLLLILLLLLSIITVTARALTTHTTLTTSRVLLYCHWLGNLMMIAWGITLLERFGRKDTRRLQSLILTRFWGGRRPAINAGWAAVWLIVLRLVSLNFGRVLLSWWSELYALLNWVESVRDRELVSICVHLSHWCTFLLNLSAWISCGVAHSSWSVKLGCLRLLEGRICHFDLNLRFGCFEVIRRVRLTFSNLLQAEKRWQSVRLLFWIAKE